MMDPKSIQRPQPARAVLSIDFDGVLHSLASAHAVNDSRLPRDQLVRAGLFCHCQQLEDLLRSHKHVDLLVHSSWRLVCSATRIRELLGPMAHRVRGIAPVDINDREASILDALRRWQVPASRVVVLDDQPFYFRTLLKNLVVCPADTGFPAVQRELDEALKRAVE